MNSSIEYNRISPGAKIHEDCKLEQPVNITSGCEVHKGAFIGRFTYINFGSKVFSNVKIGRFCSIGREAHLGLQSHPVHWLSTHPFQYTNNQFKELSDYDKVKRKSWVESKATTIGNDVWVGSRALVMNSISLADGVIVAANAVVTKSAPPYAILAGVPAKIIGFRFEFSTISELLDLKWWDLPIQDLQDLPFDDIEACILILKRRKDNQQ